MAEWMLTRKEVSKIIGPQYVDTAQIVRQVVLSRWDDIALAQAKALMEYLETRGVLVHAGKHTIIGIRPPTHQADCILCSIKAELEAME